MHVESDRLLGASGEIDGKEERRKCLPIPGGADLPSRRGTDWGTLTRFY